MTSSLVLAYLAGFFDGDGSIHLVSNASRSTRGYSLQVSVTQKGKAILERFQEAFGGGIYPTGRSKSFWKWQLGARKACDFLIEVFPYLYLKRKQAILAFEFQNNMDERGRRILTSKDLETINFYRETIQQLNRE